MPSSKHTVTIKICFDWWYCTYFARA